MLNWLRRRNAPARVAVIESLPVDGKRSVILVRRDNIEHLVMVGGRNDLVIEPNIMRRPAPNPARRPAPEWKGLPPAPTREPLAEPVAKSGRPGPAAGSCGASALREDQGIAECL